MATPAELKHRLEMRLAATKKDAQAVRLQADREITRLTEQINALEKVLFAWDSRIESMIMLVQSAGIKIE